MLTVAEPSLRGTHHTLMKELSRWRRWENILAQHQTLQKPAPAYLDQCSRCHQPVELCRCKMSSKKRGTHSAGIRGCGVPTVWGSGAARQASLALLSLCLRFPVCDSGSLIIRLTAYCHSDEVTYPSTVPATKFTPYVSMTKCFSLGNCCSIFLSILV